MDYINHIHAKEQFHFPLDINNKISKLNAEEKKVIEINKNFIEKHSWKWRIDNNFLFNLPPSIFHVKQKFEIPEKFKYKSNETEYSSKHIAGTKFTPEILNKIWEEGKFEIESKQQGLPYTWKLSNLTVKGIKNIKLRYLKDMSLSFKFIYLLKDLFNTEKYQYFSCSFLSSFYHIYLTGYNLLNLFFGMPLFRNNDYELIQKIKRDELKKFIELNPNFIYEMFDYKTLREKIFIIDDDFKKKWNNELLPKKLKIYKNQKLNKTQIKINLHNDEKIEFSKFLTQYPLFQQLKKQFKSIEEFLQSQQIIIEEKFQKDEEYDRQMENFQKELEKHSIKILYQRWKNDKIKIFSDNLEKEQNEKMNKKIKQKLERKKDPYIIFNYNIDNKKLLYEKLNQKRKEEKSPKFEFRASKLEIMPYEVKQGKMGQKKYYYVDKKKYYYVQSNFYCWRVWLFLIKLYTTFCNFNIRVYRQMTSSMLGLKALFLITLYTDLGVDSSTGKLYPCNQTFTFPRTVSNLITWICDSRNNFEMAPDSGILGKSVTRIFNLVLNYIIRLLVIGLLIITIYPTFIITNVIICFCLHLLSPLIAPAWNLIDYLFSCIIFNRYDEFKFFHLLRIIKADFLIDTVFQFILCSFCLVIQPILSIFFVIFAHIHFILRYLYDLFFYYILKFLGKIPLTDSFIARRISGPHLFRERFYDISNKDLMSLVIAEIEKMVMKNFSQKMEEILDGPKESINIMKKLYNLISVEIEMEKGISKSIHYYKNLLRKQIEKVEKYPTLSYRINIKFTEERLDNVKNLIEAYLRDYTSREDLSFELDKFEDKKIEQLTEKILINIFGKDILKTIDDVEKIVHIESVFDNSLDEISTRIFENPRYDDRVFIEKKLEEKKEIKLPNIAYFRNVFNIDSLLFLNLDLLTDEEKNKLIRKKQ